MQVAAPPRRVRPLCRLYTRSSVVVSLVLFLLAMLVIGLQTEFLKRGLVSTYYKTAEFSVSDSQNIQARFVLSGVEVYGFFNDENEQRVETKFKVSHGFFQEFLKNQTFVVNYSPYLPSLAYPAGDGAYTKDFLKMSLYNILCALVAIGLYYFSIFFEDRRDRNFLEKGVLVKALLQRKNFIVSVLYWSYLGKNNKKYFYFKRNLEPSNELDLFVLPKKPRRFREATMGRYEII